MAESPQGLHDSRFSGSGPHTTTRGASAPAVLGDLAAAERHSEYVINESYFGSIQAYQSHPRLVPWALAFRVVRSSNECTRLAVHASGAENLRMRVGVTGLASSEGAQWRTLGT